jgi:hypothetical protein
MKEREFEISNKRHLDLRDQCLRLEIAHSQATENLALISSQVDRLRSENSNLQAEKTLWKVSQLI